MQISLENEKIFQDAAPELLEKCTLSFCPSVISQMPVEMHREGKPRQTV